MTNLRDLPLTSRLHFYATAPYSCSYLDGQTARSQVASPAQLISPPVYDALVHAGFRRSGLFTYRPWCDTCHACLPLRVCVDAFHPDRSQRRTQNRLAHLYARELPLQFFEEHFALYQRYQRIRHSGGGMDQDNREQYAHFLLQSHVDTRLIELREADQLRIVCLIDIVADGFSSVYTFFDPADPAAGYGVYAILWQIARCRDLGLPYLYLGYWIESSPKMSYKSRYQPYELYRDGIWRTPNADSR